MDGAGKFSTIHSCLPLLWLSYLEHSKPPACKQAFICIADQLLKKRKKNACPSHGSRWSKLPQETVQTIACRRRKYWQENNLLGRRKTTWSRISGSSWRKATWWDLESWSHSGLRAYSGGLKWQSLPCSPQTWCFSWCYVVPHPSPARLTVA